MKKLWIEFREWEMDLQVIEKLDPVLKYRHPRLSLRPHTRIRYENVGKPRRDSIYRNNKDYQKLSNFYNQCHVVAKDIFFQSKVVK